MAEYVGKVDDLDVKADRLTPAGRYLFGWKTPDGEEEIYEIDLSEDNWNNQFGVALALLVEYGRKVTPQGSESPLEPPSTPRPRLLVPSPAEPQADTRQATKGPLAILPDWARDLKWTCECGSPVAQGMRGRHAKEVHSVALPGLLKWTPIGLPEGITPVDCPYCTLPFPHSISVENHIRTCPKRPMNS